MHNLLCLHRRKVAHVQRASFAFNLKHVLCLLFHEIPKMCLVHVQYIYNIASHVHCNVYLVFGDQLVEHDQSMLLYQLLILKSTQILIPFLAMRLDLKNTILLIYSKMGMYCVSCKHSVTLLCYILQYPPPPTPNTIDKQIN